MSHKERTFTAKSQLSRDLEARRLENAAWRLWHKGGIRENGGDAERSTQSPVSPELQPLHEEPVSPSKPLSRTQSLQNVIGLCYDFTGIRFPNAEPGRDYDDLPTFPIRPNFAGFKNQLQPASECVVFDGCPEDPYHPSNTPIYQTSTFVQPSSSEFGAYDYTRSGNPTRTALEKHVAMLEQAAAAFAFASGMAALHTVTRLLREGDQFLVNEDIYGGMHRLVTQDCVHNGVEVTFIDTTDLEGVEKAITPRTKLIHTESPSNPRMRITDLRALAAVAHRHGVLLSVDSTMMPPVICKPLTLGVDIVVHSATKFFSGHADCTGGLVCVGDPALAKRIAFLQNAEGTALSPFECFLFLRGIKTMFLRVEKAQENSRRVAAFLMSCQPHIKEVFFPGVKGACNASSLRIHSSQCHGPGCVMSFTTGSVDFSRRMLDACRIFKTTVSFGSVNSLCEMPCTMSHASIPSEKRTLPNDLVRLSIGIEDVVDLIADLDHAIKVASEGLVPDNADVFDSRFEDLPVVPNVMVQKEDGSGRAPVSCGTTVKGESATEHPRSSNKTRKTSEEDSSSAHAAAGRRIKADRHARPRPSLPRTHEEADAAKVALVNAASLVAAALAGAAVAWVARGRR